MVEKITINPNKIRAYGNINDDKTVEDYDRYESSLVHSTVTINGVPIPAYLLVYSPNNFAFDFDLGLKRMYVSEDDGAVEAFTFDSTNKKLSFASDDVSFGFDDINKRLYCDNEYHPTSYSLSFGSASYTAVGGACTVTVTLTDNSTPVSGATISVTGGTGGTGTGTTNSSGVATINVTGITASGTLTASFSNVTATASVTYSPYLFYDDCSSSSGLSDYGNYIGLRNSGTNSLTYDSTENAYLLSCTKNASESFRPITALEGYTDSFKVTITSKVPDTSHPAPTGLVMYFDNNNWYAVKEGSDRVWTGQKVNGTFSEESKPNHNLQGHTLVTVITVDNTNHTMNIKTYENSTLINYTDYSINIASATSSVKYGLDNSYGSSDKVHIYDITAEAL